MTAKEYLSQALWTEKRIHELCAEIQRLRGLARSVSGCAGERSGASGPGDRVGRAAAEIVYLEEMLGEEIKLYSGLYREIKDVIDSVGDPRYRELLRRRYLMGLTFSAIADEMHYSTQNIWWLHKKALDDVAGRLPPR